MGGKHPGLVLLALLYALSCPSFAQQMLPPEAVPPGFREDAAFAARMRAVILSSTQPAAGRYAIGRQVLDQLVRQLPQTQAGYSWDLRIAKDAGNVFSSPDGTIVMDQGLADFLGSRAGLWASALSHEVAHVVRRDWARRCLMRKSLQEAATAHIVIGEGGGAGGSWLDPKTSSSHLAAFCQRLELEADADALLLMARAGFHPFFMPALHHILQAQSVHLDSKTLESAHPLWDEREDELRAHLAAAGKQFDDFWPARYDSPGGNPPVVVYIGLPSVRRTLADEVQVTIPLHCDNLYGSVEVVLALSAPASAFARELR